jgi:hypothetical protein
LSQKSFLNNSFVVAESNKSAEMGRQERWRFDASLHTLNKHRIYFQNFYRKSNSITIVSKENVHTLAESMKS